MAVFQMKDVLNQIITQHKDLLKDGNINQIYKESGQEQGIVLITSLLELGYSARQILEKLDNAFYLLFYRHNIEEELIIPDNITIIYPSCFEECKTLKTVVIDENCKYIKYNAFNDCKNLKNVTIPKNIKSIEYGVFKGCPLIEEINYTGTLKEFENFWQNNDAFTKEIFDGKSMKVICTDGETII